MSSPVVEVFREFRFEAAHSLPQMPEAHKDRRVHGHSYRVRVSARGPVDERTGYVLDFATLKAEFAPIDMRLDHHYLNDVAGLENPTSEVLAVWVWNQLAGKIPGLASVEVQENSSSGCVYRGETGQ